MLEYPCMAPELHGPWETERTLARAEGRRSMRWWIDVPLLAGCVGLVLGAFLLIRGQVGTASAWADVALTVLLVPALLLLLVALAAVTGLVYGVARVLGWLPGRSAPIAAWLGHLTVSARRASDGIARLVVVPTAGGVALRSAWRKLWSGR